MFFFSLEKEKKFLCTLGFPGGSAGKDSACNVEDLNLIPGLEDLLQKGKATHFHYSGLEKSYTVHGVAKSQTCLSDFHFLKCVIYFDTRIVI